MTENLLGGIYFNTDISIGKIALNFTGVLNKRPLNWYISSVPGITDHATVPETPEVEQHTLKVKFIHKDGFALKGVCNISTPGGEETYCTNDNGEVSIPVSGEGQILVMLNGVKAACGNQDQSFVVTCKYTNGKFVPKKAIKKCE